MNEKVGMLLLAVLLLLVFALWVVAPRHDVRGTGGGIRLPTRTPTTTATAGWWNALPTPAPWPTAAPIPAAENTP